MLMHLPDHDLQCSTPHACNGVECNINGVLDWCACQCIYALCTYQALKATCHPKVERLKMGNWEKPITFSSGVNSPLIALAKKSFWHVVPWNLPSLKSTLICFLWVSGMSGSARSESGNCTKHANATDHSTLHPQTQPSEPLSSRPGRSLWLVARRHRHRRHPHLGVSMATPLNRTAFHSKSDDHHADFRCTFGFGRCCSCGGSRLPPLYRMRGHVEPSRRTPQAKKPRNESCTRTAMGWCKHSQASGFAPVSVAEKARLHRSTSYLSNF